MGDNGFDSIERVLDAALRLVDVEGAPPRLRAAMRHAVFPGGGRLRPKLCLAVAEACGGRDVEVALSFASAVELLHAASLVHDDLPCFDDADLRRGHASVHAAFGVPLAVLVGDGLIALSFEVVGRGAGAHPSLVGPAVTLLAGAASAGSGLVAGQGWESEARIPASAYRSAKTGALFEAAAGLGALAAGGDVRGWRAVGAKLGEAYQISDDVRDVTSTPSDIGKPTGRDALLGRPNAVSELGLANAESLAGRLVRAALAAVPPCADRATFDRFIASLRRRIDVVRAAPTNRERREPSPSRAT
jgi:geranylgeranyl diphosphate synthase type II